MAKTPRLLRAAALFLATAVLCTSCMNRLAGTTIHLMKTQGAVAVADGEGQSVDIVEELGLYSGYQVGTQAESYAWIDLDQVKLTKMDAETDIAIAKKGKSLEITVNSGSLFFNVTEPLAEDEALDIRTSDMVVGIRGTCGWVEAIDSQHMNAYILEGLVECAAAGKAGYIAAGEMARLVSTPSEQSVTVSEFTGADIPEFIREELEEDGGLVEKIIADSGIDPLDGSGADPEDGSSGPVGPAFSIAAGSHQGIIREDNSLWMWGNSMWGNLSSYGGSRPQAYETPTQMMEDAAVVRVNRPRSGGSDVPSASTAVIKTDGTLWMWGDGNFGDGIPSYGRQSPEPVFVMDNVADVCLGYDSSLILQKDGSLWSLGGVFAGDGTETDLLDAFTSPAVKVMDNVVAISTSDRTNAAVTAGNVLWMWGANEMGQLGLGSQSGPVLAPVKVMEDVAAVAVSLTFTAAIKTDGTLWVWGDNGLGQLGNGGRGNSVYTDTYYDPDDYDPETYSYASYTVDYPVQTTPVQVMDNVAAVSTENGGAAAVCRDGTLWAWGSSALLTASTATVTYVEAVDMAYGRAYDIQQVPVQVMEGVAAVDMGWGWPLVLKQDGTAWQVQDGAAWIQMLDGVKLPSQE